MHLEQIDYGILWLLILGLFLTALSFFFFTVLTLLNLGLSFYLSYDARYYRNDYLVAHGKIENNFPEAP